MNVKYTKEFLEPLVSSSSSVREVVRKIGLKETGGNHSNIKSRIKQFNIDSAHFKGKAHSNRGPIKSIEHLLVEYSVHSTGSPRGSDGIKKKLFNRSIKQKKCEVCNLTEWNGKEIPLELHHINGIKTDCRLENLQILCPNCHAQTDNYSGKNIKRN